MANEIKIKTSYNPDLIISRLANDVCKEVRRQMSKYGCIKNNDSLFKLLAGWVIVAKKDKHERPTIN